jgi:hypothetical protein
VLVHGERDELRQTLEARRPGASQQLPLALRETRVLFVRKIAARSRALDDDELAPLAAFAIGPDEPRRVVVRGRADRGEQRVIHDLGKSGSCAIQMHPEKRRDFNQ